MAVTQTDFAPSSPKLVVDEKMPTLTEIDNGDYKVVNITEVLRNTKNMVKVCKKYLKLSFKGFFVLKY